MPISEQQAIAWAGPQTADQLVPLPTHRLTLAQTRPLIDFRTAVIHCFVAGGSSPPLAWHDGSLHSLQNLCRRVLELDAIKREEVDHAYSTSRVAFTADRQEGFLRTFGHWPDLPLNLGKFPFIKIMFDPALSAEMHVYISEAVRIMMSYGTSQRSFIPLLWTGLRDWEMCSAWTRGKVLLAARNYREAVERGKHQHAHQRTNELLASMGLEPNHSLAHLPSLSARQARRSGVSESELRARWA